MYNIATIMIASEDKKIIKNSDALEPPRNRVNSKGVCFKL